MSGLPSWDLPDIRGPIVSFLATQGATHQRRQVLELDGAINVGLRRLVAKRLTPDPVVRPMLYAALARPRMEYIVPLVEHLTASEPPPPADWKRTLKTLNRYRTVFAHGALERVDPADDDLIARYAVFRDGEVASEAVSSRELSGAIESAEELAAWIAARGGLFDEASLAEPLASDPDAAP